MSNARLPKAVKVLAPIAAVALFATGCSTASDSADSPQSSPAASTGWTVEAEPAAQGAAVKAAIAGATTSLDIPIYSIISSSGEDASFTSLLAAAKNRGVNIRIMMNSGYGHAPAATAQAYLAKLQALPGKGTVAVNFSSDNFNITHQKSIIADAADSSGKALPAAQLPTTARLVVSTGNFSAGYPTTKPAPWYNARDFEMTTADPTSVTLAEQTFVSDFSCAGPTVIQPADQGPAARLIWSNGTTGPQTAGATTPLVGQYPTLAQGYYAPNGLGPQATIQGNARSMQQALIQSAEPGDTIKIYNEEFSDPQTLALLTTALGQGVKVQVVMTATTAESYGKPNPNWEGELAVAKAGGEVHLYTESSDPNILYIHAKAFILAPAGSPTATAAYSGSTNMGASSMNFNRELGVHFSVETGDELALGVLNSTFDGDFRQTENVTVWNKSAQPTPPVGDTANGPNLAMQLTPNPKLLKSGSSSVACGPVGAVTKK